MIALQTVQKCGFWTRYWEVRGKNRGQWNGENDTETRDEEKHVSSKIHIQKLMTGHVDIVLVMSSSTDLNCDVKTGKSV